MLCGGLKSQSQLPEQRITSHSQNLDSLNHRPQVLCSLCFFCNTINILPWDTHQVPQACHGSTGYYPSQRDTQNAIGRPGALHQHTFNSLNTVSLHNTNVTQLQIHPVNRPAVLAEAPLCPIYWVPTVLSVSPLALTAPYLSLYVAQLWPLPTPSHPGLSHALGVKPWKALQLMHCLPW